MYLINKKKIHKIIIAGFIVLVSVIYSFFLTGLQDENKIKNYEISIKMRMPEIDGNVNKSEYKYSRVYEEMEVYWTNDDKNIYIGIKAKTEGYISVAVQPAEKMKNADIILGFIKDGKTTIIDMFSHEEFGPHEFDEILGGEDSIIDFAGTEENGFTSIEFTRLLDTGDDYDNLLSKGDNRIIWAYSKSDDPESKHSTAGYGQIKIE